MNDIEHYYFGCGNESGHYWWSLQNGHLHHHRSGIWMGVPLSLKSLKKWDGGFAPKDTRTEGVSKITILDLENKWTVLSFWDYSVDQRPGSSSAFFFEGEYIFDELIELINEHYPMIVKRYRFEITRPLDTMGD